MDVRRLPSVSRAIAGFLIGGAVLSAGAGSLLLGVCGPFTDISDAAFCPFVLEIFTLGITTGTTPTTYDPTSSVSRLQMAAFLSRTVDGVLKRGSRRAQLDQFSTTRSAASLGLTTIGTDPTGLKSDGADIWVSNGTSGTVSRVRASDGRLLETWTGAVEARGVIIGAGFVVVTGATSPGQLYLIDPRQPAGAVFTVATNLGNSARGIAFDGARIWTANNSISIVTPGATFPILDRFWTSAQDVTTVGPNPLGVKSDGLDIWVSDGTAGTVSRVRASDGKLLETWTGTTQARGLITLAGAVAVAGGTSPGQLYALEAKQPAGAVTTLATNLGNAPRGSLSTAISSGRPTSVPSRSWT